MERHHHRISRGLSGLLVALAGLGVAQLPLAAPACAQSPAPERDVELGRELFEVGVAHLREQRFEPAAAAFRRAYRADPRVETMCNLALTYDRWGEHVELALRAYRTCARDDESGRFRSYAERRVGEIERELALEAAADPDAPGGEPSSDRPEANEPENEREEPSPLEPPPPAPPDHSALYAGLAVGGLALVSLGVAIGFAVESSAIVDALTDELGPMPVLVRGSAQHARFEDARTYADVATAMYVVMGSMLAASGALIAVDLAVAASADAPSARLRPGPAGLSLDGRF